MQCFLKWFAIVGCALVSMSGCSTVTAPKVDIAQPTTVRPVAAAPAASTQLSNGAIFQPTAGTYRPLFEDRKARYVGDTLTIQISEKTQASSKQSGNADRTSSQDVKAPGFRIGGIGITGNPVSVAASSNSTFEGKGATAADNLFTGTITATVIEVLANGNLIVSGEKQVGIGQNMETLRFSGVVNPATILNGNTVTSTQVADARIETRGKGYVDQAQTMGWLNRFFLSYWPF